MIDFKKKTILVIIFISLFACNSDVKNSVENSEKKHYSEEKNSVGIIILRRKDFNKEIISNGKLEALQKSNLEFEVSEKLSKLYVKNGSRVKKGQIIAVLDKQKAQQKLNQDVLLYKEAKLKRREILIGQGYTITQLDTLSNKIIEIVNIRSGYSSAKSMLTVARYNFNSLTLKAPFSGKIANLNCKIYEKVKSGETFCILIDDSKFEVEFSLLEMELQEISKRQNVKIRPFSIDKNFNAHISEINPIVEDNGMIKIKALISNSGNLIEGMNVEVIIENKIPNQLIVPKAAIVLRQNKEVLFRYINGKAFWTYVVTEYENSNSYTVTANTDRNAELNSGDTVIVSGNLNLAHGSEVEIGD